MLLSIQKPEIFKAYELGIVKGVRKQICSKELTNREQVAVMMHRAVKVLKPDVDFSIAGAENSLMKISYHHGL